MSQRFVAQCIPKAAVELGNAGAATTVSGGIVNLAAP